MRILGALLGFLLFASLAHADNTDWSKPSVTDLYSAVPDYIKDLSRTAAMMDYSGDTNLPTGVIRYNDATSRLERYNGSTWDALFITNLLDGAVSTTAKLADSTVTSAKIVDGTIANGDIANSTIQGGKIASATITGSNIGSATITGSNIASTTVAAGNIVNSTITNGKIASATIGEDKMNFTFSGAGSVSFTACAPGVVSFTGMSNTYMDLGDLIIFRQRAEFNVITAAPCIQMPMPSTPGEKFGFSCRCSQGATQYPCTGYADTVTTANTVVRADGTSLTFPIATGYLIVCQGFYY